VAQLFSLGILAMTSSNTQTEPLPLGAACFFAAVFVGCGVWLMLTAFHPRWRRIVHWGRMQKGPPVSLAGRVIATVATTSWAVWIIAYSSPGSAFLYYAQIVASITAVLLFVAIIHDFVIWK
jgi:hypothetical protein